MTEQMTQISAQLASLVSIPQQLSDLRDTMMTRVDSHSECIQSLQGTMNNLQETVSIMLQNPLLSKHYEQQIQTKAPQGASTALDSGRKSRSLDRDRWRRGSSKPRSKDETNRHCKLSTLCVQRLKIHSWRDKAKRLWHLRP